MKGKYKRKSEWCPNCDKHYLEYGMKCPVCGYKNPVKLKKPNKHEILKNILL